MAHQNRDRNVAQLRDILTEVPAEDGQVCKLCIERFDDPEREEKPVKLPCGHVFGEFCIQAWLQMNKRDCPFCRRTFGLLEAEDTDCDEEVSRLVEPAYPTPFWVAMLRGA